ncbi:MAG: alkaline phosphatase [Streptosporangiales bacterium]|nr:alkaline phosphatase [Streptosporangiales bacterium]
MHLAKKYRPLERFWGIDRRRFLELSGLGAAAVIFGAGPYTEKSLARVRFQDNPFKLGVASGDPLSDGVVLWTRLAPDPTGRGGMPDRKVPVQWQIARDEGFRRVVRSGTADAVPELGHSVHVEVGGLRPGREYYYRFKAGSDISPVGRTRTAPAPGDSVSQMSFAFASCQQYEHGYYTAYRHMAEENLDLIIHLGDYIYEYGSDEYVAPEGNVRHHSGPEIVSLDDYRNRHAQYRTDEDLQAAHASAPWIVTWDDHEVENNYADQISEDEIDPEEFLRRRAAAYQAYYEHMPLRRSAVPSGPDMQLYRRIGYGDLVEFDVLDTRQYRDNQAAGDGLQPPNDEQADPSRSLTGERQERWLLDGLAASTARWKILAQQVFFARLDFDPDSGERFNMDAWDGYLGSRDRILGFIEENNVRNPIVITGDVHASWASELKADFTEPESKTLGVEFVGTSIASGGDGSDVQDETEAILAENPHIRFYNNYRGYVSCTAGPGEFRADYRVVPYVQRTGAPATTRASFVVEDGRPGLNRDGGTSLADARSRTSTTERDRIEPQRRAGARHTR